MNRRTFTKMLAGAFGTAVTGLTPNQIEDRGIDLSEFHRSYSDGRYDLSAPFQFGGFDIASDGCVLIRVPGNGNLTYSDRRVPDLSQFNWDGFNVSGWKRWPKKRIVKRGDSQCRKCRGFGVTGRSDCSCIGVHEFHNQSCKKCDGSGVIGDKCAKCNGAGWFNQLALLDGDTISTRYESMISELPGVEFLPDREAVNVRSTGYVGIDETQTVAIPFRFDGGVGLVMPVRPERVNEKGRA